MSRIWFFAAAMAGGMLVALQAGTNNRLREALDGDALTAVLMSFAVGLFSLSLTVMLRGGGSASARALISSWPDVPWWALLGGVCGAGYVLSIVVGVPRIGVALCLAGVLLGQQILALGLDHFGAFGVDPVRLTAPRALGLGFLIAGTWLLRPH